VPETEASTLLTDPIYVRTDVRLVRAHTRDEEQAMLRTSRAAADDSLVVTRVGETCWILRPREALESHAVARLRDVFLEAVDSGAQDVVVDLSDVDAIAADGAAALVAMVDLMLGRNGSLWIAARADAGGYSLRPIETGGSDALIGMTPVLDAAFELLQLVEKHDRLPGDAVDLRKLSHCADHAGTDPGAPLRRRS
jgi:anti-anti-sigma regulatory factor